MEQEDEKKMTELAKNMNNVHNEHDCTEYVERERERMGKAR